MLCGAASFVDFHDFGVAKVDWLRGFLKLQNGIPSHDTFGRVYAAHDPKQFSECFRNWTQSLRTAISGEIVAFDGKTIHSSAGRGKPPHWFQPVVRRQVISNAFVSRSS